MPLGRSNIRDGGAGGGAAPGHSSGRGLARDIERTLDSPLDELGIRWTIERRTGDTPAAVRDRQRDELPTTLITTPEGLLLILVHLGSRMAPQVVRARHSSRFQQFGARSERYADRRGPCVPHRRRDGDRCATVQCALPELADAVD